MSVPLRGTMGMEGYVQRTHSGAASQLAVGSGSMVPLRGTRSLWFGSGSGTKLHITGRLYCVRGCAELIVFVGAWLRRDAIAS